MPRYESWYVWYQMDRIDRKISQCESAIYSIEAAKNSCSSTRDSWQSDFSRLTSDQDISSIQKTDVFEGEMADKLKGDIPDVRDKIRNCLSKVGNLESELSWQIGYLYNEIAELRNSRWAWKCQL